MSTHRNLMTVCFAAVFALGLAACSSSSDDPPMTGDDGDGMEMPDPAIAERAAIKSAIDAANTAVGMVNDDAADATVTAADNAIAAAKKAIMDAANVPADEKAANSSTVAVLESSLATAKTSRMAAMDAAATAAAKDAKALFDGIGETTSDLTVAVSAVTDKHGGGMASVTATGLTPGVGGADVMKSAEPMQGMWQGTMLTDTNDADASSTVVVYTDIAAPKAVPFGDEYTLDANGDLASATVIAAANRSKVKATAFMHTGRKNHDPDPDAVDDVAMIRGTFNGASGEYRCTAATATSCASHDAGNGVVRLEGTWIFDPDSGAMAMMADANYLYFGWWLNKGTTEGVEAGVFRGVTGTLAAPSDISALGGTATYAGAAAGKYAIAPGLSSASGGHWTADATLTAEWGDESAAGMISGMVDGFMAGGESMDWSVKLGKTTLENAATFDSSSGDPATGDGVVWTVGGVAGAESGAWSGALLVPGDNGVPTMGTGQFSGTHGTVGHIMGAFGVHLDE